MPTKQSLNLRNKPINIRIKNIYRLRTKLREGNVFTPFCDSVHREVMSAQWGGVHPPGEIPPREDSPLGKHAPKNPTPKTGTEAGSTHPTGIHSCLPSNGLFTLPDTETKIHTDSDTIVDK